MHRVLIEFKINSSLELSLTNMCVHIILHNVHCISILCIYFKFQLRHIIYAYFRNVFSLYQVGSF